MVPHASFRCPACGYVGNAMIVEKVSTAGWVVLVLLVLFCFPLFWIGLLMKDRHAQCPNCHVAAS